MPVSINIDSAEKEDNWMSKLIIKTCSCCHKKFHIFRWKHDCPCCNNTFCSKCLKSVPELEYLNQQQYDFNILCSNCIKSIVDPVLKKYEQSLEIEAGVKTYPATYKGKIDIQGGSVGKQITTQYFRRKGDAEKSIRVCAAFLGFNLVYNIEWQSEENSSGNYTYTVWRGVGTPARNGR
jgi:hypothetical protein